MEFLRVLGLEKSRAAAATARSKPRSKTPKGSEVMRKKQNEKNKKNKKKDIFVFVFCYNFVVFHSISMFLVSKNHARRQQPFEAKNKQKLPRVRKLFAFKDQKRVEKRLKPASGPIPGRPGSRTNHASLVPAAAVKQSVRTCLPKASHAKFPIDRCKNVASQLRVGG